MTDRYALLEHPVGHSKSPLIHGWFAEATKAAQPKPPEPPNGFDDAGPDVEPIGASGGGGPA